MRALLLSTLLLALPLPAQKKGPEAALFLQASTGQDVYCLHERIRVRLRLGFDPDFFARRGVQLYRQELDLPVQDLLVPWLQGLAGTVPAGPVAPVERGVSLVLNGKVVKVALTGTEMEGGRKFRVLEIVRELLPLRTGELVIPPAVLRFAYATGFREDLVKGRVASERQFARVATTPLRLRIDPLPQAGRPAGFDGAVGRYTVAARLDRDRARVGESLHLTLELTGRGNLSRLSAPHLGELADIHVYGHIEEPWSGGRRFVYDLVPRSETVERIPPLPFSFYEPRVGYRTVRTEPLPLRVDPLPAGTTLRHLPGEGRRARPGVDDIYGPMAGSGGGSPLLSLPVLVIGVAAPWLIALGLLALLLARERALADPAGRRARRAAATFAARLRAAPREGPQALIGYLADRLRCSPAAVVAPDLAERLVRAGVPASLAGRTADQVTRFQVARFGGAGGIGDEPTLAALVGELEEVWS